MVVGVGAHGGLEPAGAAPLGDRPVHAGRESAFAQAGMNYLHAGYVPLPCVSGEKRPCVAYRSYANDGSQPSPDEVRAWADKFRDAEILLILPAGCACLDIDTPNGHDGIDAQAQQRLLEPLLISLSGLPSERTPSDGRHYFGRLPQNFRPTQLRPQCGIRMLMPGQLVKAWPSVGYVQTQRLPDANELPLIPEDVLRVFGCRTIVNPNDPELAQFRELIPDFHCDGTKGRGRCPLHNDRNPSVSVFRDVRGRWLFCCHAIGCGARGTVEVLRRKLGVSVACYDSDWNELEDMLPPALSENATQVLLAILNIGRSRNLNPHDFSGALVITYRAMSKRSGVPLDRIRPALDEIQGGGFLSFWCERRRGFAYAVTHLRINGVAWL